MRRVGRVEPHWARYVAGVVAEVRPTIGLRGQVTTTLPVGAGLSSSAALEVAHRAGAGCRAATPAPIAALCQRAEQQASGVPCGIMDQLACTSGVAGHALLIDCHTLAVDPVPVPDAIEIVVIHSGQPRSLAGSAYADRRAECEAAETIIGPLRLAAPGDEAALTDPVLRRRARHVITENARVRKLRRCALPWRHGTTGSAARSWPPAGQPCADDFEVSILWSTSSWRDAAASDPRRVRRPHARRSAFTVGCDLVALRARSRHPQRRLVNASDGAHLVSMLSRGAGFEAVKPCPVPHRSAWTVKV